MRGFDLIPVDPFWTPAVRASQAAFGGLGVFLLFVTAFMTFVEITTAPATPPRLALAAGCCAVAEIAHVFYLARHPRRTSPAAWILFAAAVAGMSYTSFHVIKDPTGQKIFAAVAVTGGVWTGFMRWLVVHGGDWVSAKPPWVGWCLCLLAWSPLWAPFVIAAVW